MVAEPPDGSEWVSEIKFDGYRLLATVEDGKVRLLTRNGHDWAERMPAVRQTIGRLPVQAVMLDGELVALRGDGVDLYDFDGVWTSSVPVASWQHNAWLRPTKASIKRKPIKLSAITPNTSQAAFSLIC